MPMFSSLTVGSMDGPSTTSPATIRVRPAPTLSAKTRAPALRVPLRCVEPPPYLHGAPGLQTRGLRTAISGVAMTDTESREDSRYRPPAEFRRLLVSHGLFVLSGTTYSVYWVLQETAPGPAVLWTFLLALVFGIGGATGECAGVMAAGPETSSNSRLGLRHIVGACVALLVVTYVLTTVVMGRVFTSELVFVMGWATLELCSLHEARRRGWLSRRGAFAATTLVVLALAFGLVCYAVYFLLESRAQFYAALIPYGVVSLAMLFVVILLQMEKKQPVEP